MTLFNRHAAQPAARALIVLAAAWTLAGPAPAGAAPAFAPHRAVYELTLSQTRASGAMSQARGKLEFEWADVCTGWTVSQRTQVQMATTEGQVIDFGWTLNALEAKDGLRYRFFIRRFNADGSTENLRGEARLRGPGQGGLATFSSPEGREIALPKGTLFPTAHSLLLMRAAGEGDMPLWRTVFDGSGDEGLFGVNAAISQTIAPDDALGIDSPLVRGQKSWRLHLAYFGMDETVSEPQHEQKLRLFANGVVDELLLDYGDFALVARLQSLDALPELECKQE